MRTLKQLFKDVPVGSICTGTVHYYNLDSARLLKTGIIKEEGGQYFFRGFHAVLPNRFSEEPPEHL